MSAIKIFKMVANSFEVTDVPFTDVPFATPSTVAIGGTLCSD